MNHSDEIQTIALSVLDGAILNLDELVCELACLIARNREPDSIMPLVVTPDDAQKSEDIVLGLIQAGLAQSDLPTNLRMLIALHLP